MLSQRSRMLDVYTFLAFLYTYTLTCIENNQIEFQHAWGLKAGNRTGLVHQRNPPKGKARTYRSPQPCWWNTWFCVRHRMRVGSAYQEIREMSASTTNNLHA